MNKLKSYAASKRGRDTLLCFGIVIIAYIIVQAAIAGGGISTSHYKLLAFVVSAAFAGMAGTLYAMNFSTVTAAKFDFNTSILVLVFVVLGGLGNIWGSIIAATLLTLLPELLRGLSNYRMLIYAILLIAMMLFNNSSFKVRLLEKRAMRQMEKAEKAGGKKEGA